MLNKFKGVPNSHVGIIYTYLFLLFLFIVFGIISFFQIILNSSVLNLGIHIITNNSWNLLWLFLILYSSFIVFDDLLFYFLGYRSKYQIPLHKVVCSFYKKNNQPFAIDNTGKCYQLSNSELGDRNKAIRKMYLKPYNKGLILIVPCSHWGFLGIASSVIDNLRDMNGSLDDAQMIISKNFPNYRCSIRHYHYHGNNIFWYLISIH